MYPAIVKPGRRHAVTLIPHLSIFRFISESPRCGAFQNKDPTRQTKARVRTCMEKLHFEIDPLSVTPPLPVTG